MPTCNLCHEPFGDERLTTWPSCGSVPHTFHTRCALQLAPMSRAIAHAVNQGADLNRISSCHAPCAERSGVHFLRPTSLRRLFGDTSIPKNSRYRAAAVVALSVATMALAQPPTSKTATLTSAGSTDSLASPTSLRILSVAPRTASFCSGAPPKDARDGVACGSALTWRM